MPLGYLRLLCILVVALLTPVVYFYSTRTILQQVTSCFEADCFDLSNGKSFEPMIRKFAHGTRFENKVNLDRPPELGYLNFYIADRPLPGRLSAITCNCAYVGSDTVICDDTFFNSFGSSVNFTRDSIFGAEADKIWNSERDTFEKINKTTSDFLHSWIVGHEIGHAVLHAPRSSNRRIVITRIEEEGADNFFLDKLLEVGGPEIEQRAAWGLNQLIFQYFVASFRDGRARIASSRDGVHDPWVKRAMALGQRMVERSSDPSNDYYTSMANSISVEPNGVDLGNFCNFENIREQAAEAQRDRP